MAREATAGDATAREPSAGAAAPALVLVGRRTPAIAAARRAGLAVVLVDESLPRRVDAATIAAARRESFAAPPERWHELARELAAEWPVVGVAGTIERSVVPAAHMRAALGLGGDGVATAERCTDKVAMKRAVEAAGLRCARYLADADRLPGEEIVARLGLPLVVKARRGSGGRENLVLRRREEVPRRLPQGWIAEAFVEGVEMSVESFVAGGEARFVNLTEYLLPRWANVVPARLPAPDAAVLADVNRRALAALGVERGIAHLEVFLTADGPVFGELAARPPGGHLMELLQLVYRFDPWEAWLRLVIGRPPGLDGAAADRTAGTWIFHPGPGVVAAVRGVEEGRRVDGVERLDLRLRPGRRVTERRGTGQESGHVVVTGRDRDEVVTRLQRVRAALTIEMEPG